MHPAARIPGTVCSSCISVAGEWEDGDGEMRFVFFIFVALVSLEGNISPQKIDFISSPLSLSVCLSVSFFQVSFPFFPMKSALTQTGLTSSQLSIPFSITLHFYFICYSNFALYTT